MVVRCDGARDEGDAIGAQGHRSRQWDVLAHLQSDGHLDAEFLSEFADERLLVRLPRGGLAPGEFPQAGEFGWAGALGDEQGVAVDEGSRDDDDGFGFCGDVVKLRDDRQHLSNSADSSSFSGMRTCSVPVRVADGDACTCPPLSDNSRQFGTTTNHGPPTVTGCRDLSLRGGQRRRSAPGATDPVDRPWCHGTADGIPE
ncbi:hypothetical protein GCM10023114_36170 [Mycolicibacterium sediminis]|uniref:Uncharacterized protein n=1 Tax=Mycolicibacterium sediminis TaxID=1286180 RepID=A0A7I7QYC0_9MYCO|nr:hypothetical protein MSEDJ_54270 [Mycolicibacterium sediminis]